MVQSEKSKIAPDEGETYLGRQGNELLFLRLAAMIQTSQSIAAAKTSADILEYAVAIGAGINRLCILGIKSKNDDRGGFQT